MRLGEMAKTMRAASAQAGKVLLLVRHQLRMASGKAKFPHDLEKGALQRRDAHISTRRRKTLDGELKQANTSD